MLINWIPYLAGFFDGEGCIYVSPDSTYIQIEVAQVAIAPLLRFQAEYGGNIRLNKTHGRPIHKWMCPASTMMRLLDDFLPYLIVKKTQAEMAIEYRNLLPPKDERRGGAAHDALREQRMTLSIKIREAKRAH